MPIALRRGSSVVNRYTQWRIKTGSTTRQLLEEGRQTERAKETKRTQMYPRTQVSIKSTMTYPNGSPPSLLDFRSESRVGI